MCPKLKFLKSAKVKQYFCPKVGHDVHNKCFANYKNYISQWRNLKKKIITYLFYLFHWF